MKEHDAYSWTTVLVNMDITQPSAATLAPEPRETLTVGEYAGGGWARVRPK